MKIGTATYLEINSMAKFSANTELAILIKKYSHNNFVPFILSPPKHGVRGKTYDHTLEHVRKLSENAVNTIYAS